MQVGAKIHLKSFSGVRGRGNAPKVFLGRAWARKYPINLSGARGRENTNEIFPNDFKIIDKRIYGISNIIFGKILF